MALALLPNNTTNPWRTIDDGARHHSKLQALRSPGLQHEALGYHMRVAQHWHQRCDWLAPYERSRVGDMQNRVFKARSLTIGEEMFSITCASAFTVRPNLSAATTEKAKEQTMARIMNCTVGVAGARLATHGSPDSFDVLEQGDDQRRELR